jgi:D-alanyl-D-alanine dipeptidase
LLVCAASLSGLPALSAELTPGFAYLRDIGPTIRQDIRYAGSGNFLGRPAKGYDVAECVLTTAAAKALSAVQATVTKQGLTLVVFDCYRPAGAVADFVGWAKAGGPEDPQWHPRVRRDELVAKGYIGAQSSHTRGSTVDLALASVARPSRLENFCGLPQADTLDFGSGFDCFDEISETRQANIPAEAAANRRRLVEAMRGFGFRNYSKEWWHFTLENEPFAKTRFDFPISPR